MDTSFQIIAGLVALVLLVIIARALARMDREERERQPTAPPERTQPTPSPVSPVSPPTEPSPQAPVPPRRDIPLDLLEEQRPPKPVQFSAYYPREAAPERWQPLLAYVFRDAAETRVRDDARQLLGDSASDFRTVTEPARQPIAEGALVTATPYLEGFEVNPPSQSAAFYEDWQRFAFRIRPRSAPTGLAVNGRLTFTVEGIIVADVPLSIFVTEAPAPNLQPVSASSKPYDAIFCSYSRQDKQIVERIERAYKILGLTYLRDMTTIRAGEDWSAALQAMIERADIFQLFWSHTAAASKHVQMEWEYALSLPAKPPNFVRPVYWQQPMPPVPQPLQHIHFAYDESLDK